MIDRIAQIPVNVAPTGPTIGEAGAESGNTLASILSATIGALTIIASIWFIYKIITGGLAIINSHGDPKAVGDARNSITYGAIGIAVVISATFLLGLLGFIFRVDNILDVNSWIVTLSNR